MTMPWCVHIQGREKVADMIRVTQSWLPLPPKLPLSVKEHEELSPQAEFSAGPSCWPQNCCGGKGSGHTVPGNAECGPGGGVGREGTGVGSPTFM